MPWIAHMIQFPEYKSFVINFISKQGGGKGTLIEIITKVIGQAKFLETQKPLVDVFGNHNAQMATTFLVVLDELKKAEMVEVQGRFKGLVTEGTLNINPKGKDQYKIKSYHRLITTSNNDDSMPTEHGDRRNVIIKCSDEKCGDIEYFKEMRKYINNERSMWSIYDYLKNLENVPQVFDVLSFPQTEYQQNLKEASRDYIDLWLEHFTRQSNSFKIRTASSKEVFENWQEFIMENNIKCEYSSVQFMKKLSLMVVDGVKSTRTNGERKKQFDIEKLNQKYSLGCQLPK